MPKYREYIQKGFIRNEKDGVVFDTVPSFLPYVDYLFCGERQGLSFKAIRGVPQQQVRASFQTLCRVAGLPYDKVTMTHIVHGNRIERVEAQQAGLGVCREQMLPECDGLMTDVAGIPMASTHADCVPIAFYDPVHHAGAVVHAGWRGLLGQIHLGAIREMQSAYGSRAAELLIAIGPFICPECFEVGREVSRQFEEAFAEKDFILWGAEKDHLDLASLMLHGFEGAGILPEHITMDGRCTCHAGSLLHSYRREKQSAGTMVQMMMLR